MRRILLAALCAALFVFPALANDKDKGVFEFFSDEVPLYSGFAAGGFMRRELNLVKGLFHFVAIFLCRFSCNHEYDP